MWLGISQGKKKVNANFQGVGNTGLICCWNCSNVQTQICEKYAVFVKIIV